MDIANVTEGDPDPKSMILRFVCFLLIFSIAFQLFDSPSETLSHDLLICAIIILLSVICIYIATRLSKKKKQTILAQSNVKSKTTSRLFNGLFSSDEFHEKLRERQAQFRKKVNSRYQRADVLMQELMVMWTTTFTVITFGSARVFGSTMTATEKLVGIIKTKCRSPRKKNNSANDSSRGANMDNLNSYNYFFDDKSSSSADENDLSNGKTNVSRFYFWTRKPIRRLSKILFPNTASRGRRVAALLGTNGTD